MAPIYAYINVSHLGGITVHYAVGSPIDYAKPTALLIPGFMTNVDLFDLQFSDPELVEKCNLIAIDPLGHGKTNGPRSGHWTYWDNAIMMIQVMDALAVKKWWIVGTAQGGWIAPRMALLAADNIQGIVISGTSQDGETLDTQKAGCWDGNAVINPLISSWSKPTSSDSEEWVIPESFVDLLIDLALGEIFGSLNKALWKSKIMAVYKGEEGRRKAWMCAVSIKDRDSMRVRLSDIKCPVIWLHGTADPIFSVANAENEIKLFTGSSQARLEIIDKGTHYMNATHPIPVKKSLLELIA